MTFRLGSSRLTEEICNKMIEEQKEKGQALTPNTNVQVLMIDLSFIFSGDKRFVDFLSLLVRTSDKSVYNSLLVTFMIEEFWDQNYKHILKRQLAPFACHFVFAMTFFVLDFNPERDDDSELAANVFAALGFVTWGILVYQETRQIKNKGLKHFDTMWNIADFVHLGFFIVLLVVKVLPGDIIAL